MSRSEPTFVGEIQNVAGAVVSIQLRDDLQSALVLVGGESYRVGQVGAFIRIPLGYTSLYGVCTQVGAAASPHPSGEAEPASNRWLTATLFGEATSGQFERGVSQYPTVGDEVHLVTSKDLEVIYGSLDSSASITVGRLGAASGIAGVLDLGRLVARHCAIVGSTGTGKSNLVAVLLESIAEQDYPSARIIVIDPHGEYGESVGDGGFVFRVRPQREHDRQLVVPFWALPFDELAAIGLGPMQQGAETSVRDAIAELKRAACEHLAAPPPEASVTADSPIPFSINKLWFKLDDFERQTLAVRNPPTPAELLQCGDPGTLMPNIYPSPSAGGAAPFVGPSRGIVRQLELLRSRIQDSRYSFLFQPGPQFTPDLAGNALEDLDALIASWVGHERQITVLDLSGLPSEVMATVAGTLLRLVYDALFWAGDLPVGGREQPLLVVLEEAHLILPANADSAAHRTVARVAKEGRKYGVGIVVVTQRPTEIDSTVLSQCGTMISLRLSNAADRGAVQSIMPDDLGDLASMLPAMRTGEGLVMGEAMPIPSRIRFHKAARKLGGNDPNLAEAWRGADRPDPRHYSEAVRNWRRRAFDTAEDQEDENHG